MNITVNFIIKLLKLSAITLESFSSYINKNVTLTSPQAITLHLLRLILSRLIKWLKVKWLKVKWSKITKETQ